MKNQFSKRTVIGVVLMVFSLMANAQTFIEIADADKEYVFIKTDNKVSYVGYIADEMKDSYTLQTDEANIIFIEKSTIKVQLSIDKENIVNGEYWAPNPSTNIMTSNAFGLKKGEGFYQNNMIVINSVGYGVSDNVSLSAGFESVSILANNGLPAFFVSGKYSKKIAKDFSLGASGSIIKAPTGMNENGNTPAVGLLTGLVTYGTRNRNVTAGIFVGVDDNGLSKPMLSLASQFRVSKRLALLGDVLFVPNGSGATPNKTGLTGTSMFGLRFLGDNVIVDGSIWVMKEVGVGIPMMSVRIPFGNRS